MGQPLAKSSTTTGSPRRTQSTTFQICKASDEPGNQKRSAIDSYFHMRLTKKLKSLKKQWPLDMRLSVMFNDTGPWRANVVGHNTTGLKVKYSYDSTWEVIVWRDVPLRVTPVQTSKVKKKKSSNSSRDGVREKENKTKVSNNSPNLGPLERQLLNTTSSEKLSDYEKRRLQRIKENRRVLCALGIASERASLQMSSTTNVTIKTKEKKSKKRQISNRKPTVMQPARKSRRIRGIEAEKHQLPLSESIADVDTNAKNEELERLREEDLRNRWALDKIKAVDENKDRKRQIFLIPTGVPGVNDHTLHKKQPDLDSHLWGFCEGLYSRIFKHIKPGDLFICTSSGTGQFNLVAEVKETRIVPRAESDRFWSRMSFCMGGTAKKNVGFPLLVLLKPPVKVEWEKMEVMRLFGYTDHLQSSRRITVDRINSMTSSKAVYQKCLDTLKG
eukprot:g5079.t1